MYIIENNKYLSKSIFLAMVGFLSLITSGGVCQSADMQGDGVTPTSIRIGSIMDLDDETQMRGQAIKIGLESALKGEKVEGRTIELTVLNDSYSPQKAVERYKETD
jgi:hypothetical protein